MKPDELDRWLTEDDAIVPSSGFSPAVMEAVVREASAPPAIPFPWTRALPGLASLGVALLAIVVGTTILGAAPADQEVRSVARQVISAGDEAGWIAAALMVTAASLAWSWRLARG